MYNKPNSQYSKLVMAARKAETETPGGGVLDSWLYQPWSN